jgi:hypothetical protein
VFSFLISYEIMMALQNLQAPVLHSMEGNARFCVALCSIQEGFFHPFAGGHKTGTGEQPVRNGKFHGDPPKEKMGRIRIRPQKMD